jgi:TonB family protein
MLPNMAGFPPSRERREGGLSFSVLVSVTLVCIAFASCNSKVADIKLVSGAPPVDKLPAFVHLEEPIYPPLAKMAMIEEVVLVELTVGVNGFPRDVVAVKDTRNYAQFQESAEDAGMKCTFTPALRDGKPIESRVRIVFKFKISAEDRRRDAIRRRLGG